MRRWPARCRADRIRLSHQVTGLDEDGAAAVLRFAGGGSARHDAVVAADGVHSLLRDLLFGQRGVNFTGRIAYRTTFPAALLAGQEIDECTKWWGEDRHIVIYFVKPDRSEVYFVTSQPEPGFTVESWSGTGDVRTLRAAFAGFHPQVRHVLAACPAVHKWALADRDPLARWHDRNVTLLGDACHPMTPYMAQGAAMALEDAAVLARLLDGVADQAGLSDAFRRFEATRKGRTSRVQLTSRANTWLRGKTDVDWVYCYNPWTVPLAAALVARLRRGAVDLRVHAQVVQRPGDDGDRGRAGPAAIAQQLVVVATLPSGEGADDQPNDKNRRSDVHTALRLPGLYPGPVLKLSDRPAALPGPLSRLMTALSRNLELDGA